MQSRLESGLDLVTAAAVRLADGTPATLALSGVSPGALFELTYFGETGRLRVTDQRSSKSATDGAAGDVDAARAGGDHRRQFRGGRRRRHPAVLPGRQALDTVRLLEAIARSAATGQVVRLA